MLPTYMRDHNCAIRWNITLGYVYHVMQKVYGCTLTIMYNIVYVITVVSLDTELHYHYYLH